VSNNIRVLTFAVVLGVTCSALLAGVSWLTEPYRTANEEAEEVQNILAALGVTAAAEASPDETLAIFNDLVTVREVDGVEIYEYSSTGGGAPEAIAVSVRGAGLWGPVEGVLALESDMNTIRGVRFFKQEETPGLGGEIGSEWFQDQFGGKSITDANGVPGIRVVKPGEASGQNVVDSITGATMTSQRVETMLNEVIDVVTGGM